MTQKEFMNCQVGDNILSSTLKIAKIEDINRSTGMITIGGGKWRHFSNIRFPPPEIKRMKPDESSEMISVNRKLLIKYGFPRTLIIQAIANEGDTGFIGSTEELSEQTEFISICYTRTLIVAMLREKLIKREKLSRKLYRFVLCNPDKFLSK